MSCSRALILSQESEVGCGWRMLADLHHRTPSDPTGSLTGSSCSCSPRGCASGAHPARSPPSPSESNQGKVAEIEHVQHCGFCVHLDGGDLRPVPAHWTSHGSMGRPAGGAGLSWAWSQRCGTLVPWRCCNSGSSPTGS